MTVLLLAVLLLAGLLLAALLPGLRNRVELARAGSALHWGQVVAADVDLLPLAFERQRDALIEANAYNPADEKDACGVGLVAQIDGTPRREIVEMAVRALKAVFHRGAIDAAFAQRAAAAVGDLSRATIDDDDDAAALAEVGKHARRIAEEMKLPNAKKKDSTGICFIGERPFREFLNRYISKEPGPIKNAKGQTIGEHVGLSFYTLGQRQGLGIGGLKAKGAQKGGGDHAPWFVARKDMQANVLWVVQGHDHPWLQSPILQATDVSWCAGTAPEPGHYAAKTRYRQADAPCSLQNMHMADGQAGFELRFAENQWAVTPGQSAVVYDGEVCLGGGVIHSAPTLTT